MSNQYAEQLPPDPFPPPNRGEHPFLEVTRFGMAFGWKDFGDGIVKVQWTVQTLYGDLHFYVDADEALTLGEAFVAQAAFVKHKESAGLWKPGDN